jgi:uncharacterized coiled-coil protein SlyX
VAETGEIVAGAGVLGTAIAAFLAAFGWRNKSGTQPPRNGELNVLAQRITELERRQTAMDERIEEVFHLMGDVNKSLSQAQADVREALTRLQERRK